MPIDPSIPLQVRGIGPIANPLDVMQGIQQMRSQREQTESLAEQRRANAERLREQSLELARARKREADFAKKYAETNGNPTYDDLAPIVGPDEAQKVVQARQTFASQAFKSKTDAMTWLAGQVGAVGAIPDGPLGIKQKSYDGLLQGAVQSGILSPDEVLPYGPESIQHYLRRGISAEKQHELDNPAPVALGANGLVNPKTGAVVVPPPATKPPTPSFQAKDVLLDGRPSLVNFDAHSGKYMVGDQDVSARVKPIPPAPAAPRDERIVQVMGQEGTPIWVRESQAVGKPAAQAARAVTGIERNVLAFYNRAEQAAKIVAPLEDTIAKMGLAGQTGLQVLPNFLQPEKNQSYRQAQRAFTEARLRKESGAAVPAGEYENDAKTYFAQPGDTKANLEQKKKARQEVLDGLAFSAGKAYDEYYGSPFQTPAREAKPGATVNLVYDPATGTFKKPGGAP